MDRERSRQVARQAPPAGVAAQSLVTVVVRSMDRPHLSAALASLARQDYPALEVLVVDATGGRHAPLPPLRMAATHTMRLVSSGQRLPRAQAADLGLTSAAGEWLTFLDDDDTCEPTHISGLVAAARDAPDALVVYGCGRLLDSEDRLDQVFGRPFNRALMHFGPLFYWQASLIRTRVRDLGCRFDPAFEVCEDRDFLAQVAAHGDFFFAPHLATFNYRPDLGTSGTGNGPNRDFARVARFEGLLRAKWAGEGTWHNERVAVHCRRGVAAFHAGDLEASARSFETALDQYPGDPNALNGLARVALARGDPVEAERLARAALAINPAADEYLATLVATGAARVVAPPAQRQAPVSRLSPCPCGSGQKFKACCGRLAEGVALPVDPVDALCARARQALGAGEGSVAFEVAREAASIRCDATVGRLLEDCAAKLAEREAQASLWDVARRVCAATATPAVSAVRKGHLIGDRDRLAAALRALRHAGVASDEATWRGAAALDAEAEAPDDASCVAFCAPDDVPAYGICEPGPGRAVVLTRGDDAAALLRALARLSVRWPRAQLGYFCVSV